LDRITLNNEDKNKVPSSDNLISRVKPANSRYAFLKSNILWILVWPTLSLILVAILWYWTDSRIDAERHILENKALHDATLLSKDYEQYLAQTIEQVNQITLQVQYNWEQSNKKLDLLKLSEGGIFRSAHVLNVIIINRDGLPVTSIVPPPKGTTYLDRDYFIFHKNDDTSSVLAGRPVLARSTGKPSITFTRRLNAQNGLFDGVVVVAIDPAYLTAFYAGSFPGKTGLLALVGLDGILRSITIGDQTQNSTLPALRTVSLFNSPEGATYLKSEQWVGDNLPRFVAWKTMKDYPLVAIVGVSEQEYHAPQQETWATYKKAATLGSTLLFLFALVAAGMSIRIARKKYQEEEVRKAYLSATESGNEGYYMFEAVHDKNGSIIDFLLVDCNERGAEFFGMKKMNLRHVKLSSLYPAIYFDDLMKTFLSAMESGFHEEEFRMPRYGKSHIEWAKRRLMRTTNGLTVTLQDITERKQSEEKIEFLAHHDPLTHLPNRVLLRDRFEQAMMIAKREETGVAMMFLDLDNFKQINDGFGHPLGDQLLIKIVNRLQDCVRDADTISRQGGDEFIILLTNISDINDISRIAQNMLDAVLEPIEIENQTFHTSASIGITLSPNDGDDFDTLLKNADTAMYQAKESGRNAYRFFTAKMNADVVGKLLLLTQLRSALQQKEFQLHYQPQIDLLNGKVIGMEALIRWHHPEQGLISPARFIPVAETSGLIIPIGEWVLEEACRQARIWLQDGRPPFRVAVNLSALQFKRGNILDTVSKVLENSGLPPDMMELELTESILLQDMEGAIKTIHDLKMLGVQLSIDDFGTGYSSLSYLKQLQVDKLKIDQSFVRDLVTDVNDMAIVRAIIQLGKSLDMRVIAEGVETAEQLDFLGSHECDEAQGYFICRPKAAADLDDWLDAKNHQSVPGS
jgi:diguanylate cyclase (GGDEF)-like protein/PAS domain S-box-containing protein